MKNAHRNDHHHSISNILIVFTPQSKVSD